MIEGRKRTRRKVGQAGTLENPSQSAVCRIGTTETAPVAGCGTNARRANRRTEGIHAGSGGARPHDPSFDQRLDSIVRVPGNSFPAQASRVLSRARQRGHGTDRPAAGHLCSFFPIPVKGSRGIVGLTGSYRGCPSLHEFKRRMKTGSISVMESPKKSSTNWPNGARFGWLRAPRRFAFRDVCRTSRTGSVSRR